MAAAAVRDELLCSICLSTYTDPVMLRCGHNFCLVCIHHVLNTQDASRVYSCPDCREEFQERPALMRNLALRNIMENFLITPPTQTETGIFCTYCVDSPVPAVRSCLHCEASRCEKRLRVHSKSEEHVLSEPTTNLENRKCSVHKKILEYYCTEDAICICVSCRLAGEHRGHQVEMLKEATAKKKENLRNVLQKLTTKRKETEEGVQSLEERRRKAHEKAAEEAERVSVVFTDIRRQLDDLEKNVLSEISQQVKEKSLSLSALMKKLEIQRDELSRKMRHMEELCNMTDPLTVLQEPETGDLCDPDEKGGEEDTKGHYGGEGGMGGHDIPFHDVDRLDLAVISDTLHTICDIIGGIRRGIYVEGPADILLDVNTASNSTNISDDWKSATMTEQNQNCPETSERFQYKQEMSSERYSSDILLDVNTASNSIHISDDRKTATMTEQNQNRPETAKGFQFKQEMSSERYSSDILLDVNTASNSIHISDDRKTATMTEQNQNRPETAKRFQFKQVMSSQRFSSGRHYWDVEINRSEMWRVGMCYRSIDRKGPQSYIGYNHKSWCLRRYNNQYSVRHDTGEIQLPDNISSNRFRICLDYEAGWLSFYELCDPIRHLHTFTATFSKPLHAALWVGNCSITILGSNNWEKP